ncbi:MAG: ASKHA domain-containing protein, partial [Geminicoccales bacterium]
QVVRKRAEVRAIALDPVVRLHYVEVEPPDMAAQRGDLERLLEALRAQWQLGELSCDLAVLQSLQPALRDGGWKVTVAVHEGERIVAVWPGFVDRAFGLAIDVGSTTIAGHLCDLHSGEVLASGGLMNPQIRFGEDLMSRVSYAMMNPGGAAEMTAAVREALRTLIAQVTAAAGIDPGELLALTAVGNPIMHHLLLGIDPRELGTAPFALALDHALSLRASELDLAVHPGARVYLLPCIAGHVGADTAGVILSETPHLADEMTLIVDVGTNAEIVLGNRHRLLAASSPTGPAFEGAQISCGQRAAPGAIERVRIDPKTLEPRFKVIGCDLWSDQPGFAEAARRIGVTGICGSGIIEALAEMF